MQIEGKVMIQEWKESAPTIANLFHDRKYQEAAIPMQRFAKQYVQLLFLLNKKNWDIEQDSINEVGSFKYEPLNIEERIAFIQSYPNQYHCYIHLNELYNEIEKLFAKAEILDKQQ